MLNPFVSCIIYALEALIYYIFLSRVSNPRFCKWKCILIGLCLFEVGSAFNILSHNDVFRKYICRHTYRYSLLQIVFWDIHKSIPSLQPYACRTQFSNRTRRCFRLFILNGNSYIEVSRRSCSSLHGNHFLQICIFYGLFNAFKLDVKNDCA